MSSLTSTLSSLPPEALPFNISGRVNYYQIGIKRQTTGGQNHPFKGGGHGELWKEINDNGIGSKVLSDNNIGEETLKNLKYFGVPFKFAKIYNIGTSSCNAKQ